MPVICIDCENDDKIFCKRDADAKCLICNGYFCGAHIGSHLQNEHCVALDNRHCAVQEGNADNLMDDNEILEMIVNTITKNKDGYYPIVECLSKIYDEMRRRTGTNNRIMGDEDIKQDDPLCDSEHIDEAIENLYDAISHLHGIEDHRFESEHKNE
jgi:hypothetical protein